MKTEGFPLHGKPRAGVSTHWYIPIIEEWSILNKWQCDSALQMLYQGLLCNMKMTVQIVLEEIKCCYSSLMVFTP